MVCMCAVCLSVFNWGDKIEGSSNWNSTFHHGVLALSKKFYRKQVRKNKLFPSNFPVRNGMGSRIYTDRIYTDLIQRGKGSKSLHLALNFPDTNSERKLTKRKIKDGKDIGFTTFKFTDKQSYTYAKYNKDLIYIYIYIICTPLILYTCGTTSHKNWILPFANLPLVNYTYFTSRPVGFDSQPCSPH